jgi:oxalate decarboxylase
MGSAALVGAGLMAAGSSPAAAAAQSRKEMEAGRQGDNATDIGPVNRDLRAINPNSNNPPITDRANPEPIWYSFDLTHKRVTGGGWTHQVTQRELPTSKELAGVNMRLTAGSFRELHWHTANEWAIMLAGKARVTLLKADGKMFIDDVQAGDLWYFPAGLAHSIQALGGEGCEFLLVFDNGQFSEDETFLLSETLAHTPPEIVRKNMGWTRREWETLPETELYIFPSNVPGPLEADKGFLGEHLDTATQYTFHGMSTMPPTYETAGGSIRIVDSGNFGVSQNIAAALVTLKPGAIRELHWHPNGGEWQYWIKGKGRMSVMLTGAKARTMDFNAGDVGYVPAVAAHYIENTGTEDVIFLEMFKAPALVSISMNEWIARMPDQMVQAHLNLPLETVRRAPQSALGILPR